MHTSTVRPKRAAPEVTGASDTTIGQSGRHGEGAPYWKGSMVRPSTWHTSSTLVMGPDPILGSFDARRAHGT